MIPLVESELIDGLSIRYLKYYGQWRVINEYRTTGRTHYFLIIQIILTAVIILPFTIFQFICPLYIMIDLEKATILTLHTLSCIQSYAKPGVFLFYAKTQSRLFDVIRRDLLTCIPPEKQVEASRIYKKISSRSNLFCFLANFTNFFGTSIWCSTPGMRSEYIAFHVGNMNEVTTGPVKILGGWYPIPFTVSPWAEIVYFYEILVLLWCCIVVSLYECMLIQLVMSLYAHFQVLGYHLSTLRGEHSTHRNFLYEQYLAIIKDHQKLLRYGAELKKSFNFLLTILLGTGAVILIISIFQFVFGKKSASLTIKFILYLSYQTVEFVTICVSATLLETASSNIQFAIYESDWYRGDKKLRNTAQMVMVRSGKPVSLSAVKMYPVNVQTLMNVVQFTYSVSALMSRMLE